MIAECDNLKDKINKLADKLLKLIQFSTTNTPKHYLARTHHQKSIIFKIQLILMHLILLTSKVIIFLLSHVHFIFSQTRFLFQCYLLK